VVTAQPVNPRKTPGCGAWLPDSFPNLQSGTTNQILTPGDGALLAGYRLRYDPADPAQGIFLIA
jgi:hypothetical protein